MSGNRSPSCSDGSARTKQRCYMRSVLCLALLALPGTLPPAVSCAAEPASEMLLLGFEEEDFARLGKAIKITRKESKSREGKPCMAWESPGGFAQIGQWMVYKGNAS